MNKCVKISEEIVKIYHNWRERKPTNEEIYEANIRSSFSVKRYIYDKVEIQTLKG